jgi:dihydrodipicolinate synthase/N-acetylneuraminate lyase
MRNGVYAANVTPFRDDADFTLDVDAYRQHVAWLASEGVAGVAPFGTNGEGPSVSREEKLAVLDALVRDDLAIDLLPVLTEGNLPDTLWLLERVNDLPVGGVLVLPPHYFRPVAADGLRAFYERVVESSQHPVLVYHIPTYSVPVPADLVASMPVWGAKNSAVDDPEWSDTIRAAGKQVMVGTEIDLVRDLPDSHGAISALANIVPAQMVEMHRRVADGDLDGTAELAAHLRRVSELTKEAHDSPGVLKVLAQAQSGIPMGTVRPPLLPPPAGYDVEAALQRLRFTEPVG